MASNVSNYRPNPDRSINLFGEFSEELTAVLLPEVLKLRSQNNEPITAYIHSRGGLISEFEAAEAALRARAIDGTECRIITVAVGDVSSAAAFLLTLGHYSIAYPQSTLLFHGIRIGDVQVTFEGARNMAGYLARINRKVARRIAKAILPRVMFRLLQLRQTVNKKGHAQTSPVDLLKLFEENLSKRVGSAAGELLSRTCNRVHDAQHLTDKILANTTASFGTCARRGHALACLA
jgi:ATP-dependent protease ClpP protease subunit